ncbi:MULTISPECIES: hypothetical protein [unclassified Kribbella]|uniref:hypothetical protein n=1 Tax=unclassified Kribbella TaxID=2644121 RepID=UPI003076B3D3
MKADGVTVLKEMPLALSQLPPVKIATEDDGDGAIPAELREWMVRLRLLDGVPFAYLVADTELLPPESIRWFYVDRRWTDALIQGVLAVGTVNSDDRTQLANRYPQVRAELDNEERNFRRRTGSNRYAGESGPISGFLLRSRAVSGWPALHVRAFSIDPGPEADQAQIKEDQPGRMRLLRLERLAPAVLLCLFDGVPKVVHLEEPRQGVQFGFDASGEDDNVTATLKPRNATTFEYLPGAPITVPFRVGTSGVVDIQRLERKLKDRVGSGAADGLDSSEYALQLVRFPFRQVWGDPEPTVVRFVFKPTVSYQVMVDDVFQIGGP